MSHLDQLGSVQLKGVSCALTRRRPGCVLCAGPMTGQKERLRKEPSLPMGRGRGLDVASARCSHLPPCTGARTPFHSES